MEEATGPPVDVWPDNWRSVEFFSALGNGCWSIGPAGAVGLKPESFREVRLALRITGREWPDIYSDVRVMERTALDILNAKRA